MTPPHRLSLSPLPHASLSPLCVPQVAFELAQADHLTFTRAGDDLHATVFPSSPWALMRGETQQVRHLDGRSLAVPLRAWALSARVKGEGMPVKGGGNGDMVVHLLLNIDDLRSQMRQ